MSTIKMLTATMALLSVGACQSPTAKVTNGATIPAEVDFVTNDYQVIRFDQEAGKQARTQARDPRVKALAQKLLDEANQFEAQLAPIAKDAGIKPPNVLRNDLRVRAEHMRLQHGLDFDRTYLDDEIASHEEALRGQEAMMNGGNARQALKDLAGDGEALLRTNLQTLLELRRDISGH